jgi:hypothetical protein
MFQLNPSLIPILASIITGAAAFLGVLLTNKFHFKRIKLEHDIEAERKRQDLYRDRGEELYVSVEKWLSGIQTNYLSVLRVMQGKLTYDGHTELTIKSAEKQTHDFTRLEMLIDVYFPETKSLYMKVHEARKAINKVWFEHERQYEGGDTDGLRFIAPFVDAQNAFETAGTHLKEQIKKCISAA